jgi:hypothetical protein
MDWYSVTYHNGYQWIQKRDSDLRPEPQHRKDTVGFYMHRVGLQPNRGRLPNDYGCMVFLSRFDRNRSQSRGSEGKCRGPHQNYSQFQAVAANGSLRANFSREKT